jgi:hypothetical protein
MKTTTTTPAINTKKITDAPDNHGGDVEVSGPSSIASGVDAPATARRYRQSSISEFLVKVSGKNASATATATSSLVPSELEAPEREHGFGLGEFQGNFSSTDTADQDVSRPGAVRVGVSIEAEAIAGSSDAPRRERGFGMDAYHHKCGGEAATASAAEPSSLAPPVAHRRERVFGMDEYNCKRAGKTVTAPVTVPSRLVPLDAPSSATEDQEPEAHESNSAIKDGPDDHDDGDVEVGGPSSIAAAPPRRNVQSNIDGYQRKRAGKTKSSTPEPASVVPPDAPPRRERGLQGKVSSAPGQDVSGPGAFRVGVDAGSSNAPTGDFNKDEYRRQRPGQTTSVTAPSSSVPSDAPPRRQGLSNMDAYHRKVARGTASAATPSSSTPPDAPTRKRGFGMDEYNRKVAGETASAAAPSSSVMPDVPATRDWRSNMDAYNKSHERSGT